MELKLLLKKSLVWLLHKAPIILGLFLILIFVYYFYALFSVVFVVSPNVLNSTITALPINNNTYPILLQGLLIVASMIFGFYGILLFYSSKELNKIIDKYLGKSFVAKLISFVFILLPLSLLILSIFFSLNGLTYYGITIAFTTEQINMGHIPVTINNSSIENSTYFNLVRNSSKTAQKARGYYNKTLSNAQSSIKMIFLSAIFITAVLVIYLLEIFGTFKYLYDKYNSNKMAQYTIDILIFAIIIGAFLYYKVYILIIEFIFLLILALIIKYLLNYREKKKAKQKSIDNSTIPPPR